MIDRPSVVCPVDFSEGSGNALRYAVAVAEHFFGVLTVSTIDDPLLASGSDAAFGHGWLKRESLRRLEIFITETLHGRAPAVAELHLEVGVGKPAPEIIRLAETQHADLIVISTRGRRGASKWFLGSTAERVLRDTSRPVLVTPADVIGPTSLEAAREGLRCVFAPVDLSDATLRQVRVAAGLAEALGAALVLGHIDEPLVAPASLEGLAERFRIERQRHAERALRDLFDAIPATVQATAVTASGDAAEEISHLIAHHHADLVVMGLHASPAFGPRMGSVTYRVLCGTDVPVLALPPLPAVGRGHPPRRQHEEVGWPL
jgi:nucleotide-binding universal stress UspA family protein